MNDSPAWNPSGGPGRGVAEVDGNRTHPPLLQGNAGFEARGRHQSAVHFRSYFSKDGPYYIPHITNIQNPDCQHESFGHTEDTSESIYTIRFHPHSTVRE